MEQGAESRRATVHDVARAAGVSLATVDRVINGRPGVRPETVARVEAAVAALGFTRDLSASLLARARALNVLFLLPDGGNEFMGSLAASIARQAPVAAAQRMALATSLYHPLDPADLAARLAALDPRRTDCAVIVAPDDPALIAAVDAAHARGVAIITLVSDLPAAARRHFIGIDNVAAGRTAASLLGRFCSAGDIGIVAGSMALADHRQRHAGFVAVMAAEFPALHLAGPVEGRDDDAATEAAVTRLLGENPGLVGLYALGAGTAGLLAALERSGRAHKIRVIAHELTETARRGLSAGVIDVVLDQNPDAEIRAAIAAARQAGPGQGSAIVTDPIEIGVFLRDNLR